ncbi:hypothetical protein ElyMa_001474100 [Elysia marginata]|uniref:Uncharacterized protein n=1 Tax=Elysia marginata TaxID=1093978 RepID=A0AAV4J105_9GAST|nr:hypothetical protein ElyMa_001474100 [Elysia marginata]
MPDEPSESVNCLNAQVKRTFVLRHRNQTGPYPVDFVRFIEGRQRPDLEINYKSELCQIGSNCSLRCDAIGEITSMQVTQMSVEDDQWEPVENTSELVFDYSRSTYPDVYHIAINCTVVGRPVSYTYVDLRFELGHNVEYHHQGAPTQVPISLEETVETYSTYLGPHTSLMSIEHLTGARCFSTSLRIPHRNRQAVLEMDWPQSPTTSTSN